MMSEDVGRNDVKVDISDHNVKQAGLGFGRSRLQDYAKREQR